MTTVLQNFFDLASEKQPITAIPNSVGRQGDLHVRERTHAMHSLLYILLTQTNSGLSFANMTELLKERVLHYCWIVLENKRLPCNILCLLSLYSPVSKNR